jgi:hypothetical protein
MKFLKHLGTFVVCLLLFLTIFGYTLILNVKDVVQHQLIAEVIKQAFPSKEGLNEEETKKINEIISTMTTSEDVDEIINNIIGEVDNLSKGKSVSDKTLDMIIHYFSDHLDDINKITKQEYTLDDINSSETRENLKKSIEEVYKEISKDDSKIIVKTVTTYGTVTSKNSTLYVIGIVLVLLVLLALINFSYYKWIKPFGIVMAVSGSIVSFIYLFFNVAYDFIVKNVNLDIKVDTRTILFYGVGEIVLGILILIVYSIITKIIKKNKHEEPNLFNNDLTI